MEESNVESDGESSNGSSGNQGDDHERAIVPLGPEILVSGSPDSHEMAQLGHFGQYGAEQGALVPMTTGAMASYEPSAAQLRQNQGQKQCLIAGGVFDGANIGGTNITNITNILQPAGQKAPAPESATETRSGARQRGHDPDIIYLASEIAIYEKNPINAESRIFRGELCSDVTGPQDIIVKVLPDGERQRREARMHFSVPHHHNIVHRISTNTFKYRGLSSIYIAMELCDQLNLYQYIRQQNKNKAPFDSELYTSFAFQIVTGLAFLHKHKVFHRDLKPHSLLLAENRTVIKITDFGLSKTMTSDQISATHSMIQPGTDGWKSPEILLNAEKISISADIFSLGLVLFHVLSFGKHPFGEDPHSWNHYIKRNENLNLGGLMVARVGFAEQMLMSTLQHDPKQRSTAEEILNHPFFKGNPPLSATKKQLSQLVSQTISRMTKREESTDKKPMQVLLPGVQETSVQLSRFLDEKSLEIKQKMEDMQHIQVTEKQICEIFKLAFSHYHILETDQQGAVSSAVTSETAVTYSNTLKRFLKENCLEIRKISEGSPISTTETCLMPKLDEHTLQSDSTPIEEGEQHEEGTHSCVQRIVAAKSSPEEGDAAMKINQEQLSQLASETLAKMGVEGNINIDQMKQGEKSLPWISDTAHQLAQVMTDFLQTNNLEIKSGAPEDGREDDARKSDEKKKTASRKPDDERQEVPRSYSSRNLKSEDCITFCHQLYYDKNRNFISLFCINDQGLQDKCDEALRKKHFHCSMPSLPDFFEAGTSEDIKMQLCGARSGQKYENEVWHHGERDGENRSFDAGSIQVRGSPGYLQEYFTVDPSHKDLKNGCLELVYTLQINGNRKKIMPFNLEWPLPVLSQDLPRGQEGSSEAPVNFFTFNQNKTVGALADRHGTINTKEDGVTRVIKG